MKKMIDIARVIRSKNSGPFELVLDIMFKDNALFEKMRTSEQFNAKLVAQAYGIPEKDIRKIIWFRPSNAVKVVLPRYVVSGAPGDSDVYGAQQHAPLLGMEFNI